MVQTIRDNPGLRPKDIVDRLEQIIVSDAKDKRKMLFQTIVNQRKNGRLVERDGKLFVDEQLPF